jgi:hypothetical protein
MVAVILVEPYLTAKPLHCAATLLGPKCVFCHPTVEEHREQLRRVRGYFVGHLEPLVEEPVSRLTSGRPIAADKSAVITEGLVKGIVATNPDVIETCNVQFKCFDTDVLVH